VDPFALIMLAIVGGLVVVLLLLGRFYPGSGAQQLDWRPARSVETEVQNEIDDMDQMRDAINARRRARGQAELTDGAVRDRVAEDLRARIARREDPDDEAQHRAALAERRQVRADRDRDDGGPV
jgi:hypothetical protein